MIGLIGSSINTVSVSIGFNTTPVLSGVRGVLGVLGGKGGGAVATIFSLVLTCWEESPCDSREGNAGGGLGAGLACLSIKLCDFWWIWGGVTQSKGDRGRGSGGGSMSSSSSSTVEVRGGSFNTLVSIKLNTDFCDIIEGVGEDERPGDEVRRRSKNGVSMSAENADVVDDCLRPLGLIPGDLIEKSN